MKDLILIPTYNERQSIGPLLAEIFSEQPEISVTVIDDSSPDGTAEEVRLLKQKYPNLDLYSRPEKNGLGNAYKDAMFKALSDNDIRLIITMDADGSHPVSALKDFLRESGRYGLVIGSRYISGGGVSNWAWWRRLLSRCGNYYNQVITGLPIHDLSAGFMCISREALSKVDLAGTDAAGYAFLPELKYKLIKEARAKSLEVPIIFTERRFGVSKLSGSIIKEGLLTPWRIRLPELFKKNGNRKSTSKKSLLICTGIYPPDIGGPATYVPFLQRELPHLGLTVKVITYGNDSHKGISELTVVSRRQNAFFRYFKYFCQVYKDAPESDVIYVQGPVSEGLPTALACALRRRNFTLKVVGDFAWEQGSQRCGVKENLDEFKKMSYGFKVQLWRCIEGWVARRAYRVITPSNYLKGIVSGWGVDPEKITVIYNSVERITLDASRDELRRKLDWNGFVAVSVGRLVLWKGFDALITAVKDLAGDLPDFRLVIIGDGPKKNNLQKLIDSNGLQGKVELAGQLDRKQVAERLAAADLMVLNTSYEGLSHVLIEAIMANLPIITTNVGGNPELIESYGRGSLIEYNNIEQLISAMQSAYDKPAKADVPGVARPEFFNSSFMLKKTAEALSTMPAKRRGFIYSLSLIEKIALFAIFISFFAGITYGFPSTVGIMDEMYFVGGVMRAIARGSILPFGMDVPYGTINYMISYLIIGVSLLVLFPFFGFSLPAMQGWIFANSHLFYLSPRLVSILAATGLLFLSYRIISCNWPDKFLRLGLVALLFSNLLFSSLIRSGKVWMLSIFLIYASFYFLYEALGGKRRMAFWAIIFSALAFANFPLAGLALIAWPIIYYFAPQIGISRRQAVYYCLSGVALAAAVFVFNYSGIKYQVLSIFTDYTFSADAKAHNLTLLASFGSYFIKSLLVFSPLWLAGAMLFGGIRNKKLFYLSSAYFLLYFFAVVFVARWTDGIYSFLRYLGPLGVFGIMVISSFEVSKNRFRQAAFYALVAVSLAYFAFFACQLLRPTTYVLARNWLVSNANSRNILVINRIGAKLDLPLSRQSALLMQDKFCGSRCEYYRNKSEKEDFSAVTISEESNPLPSWDGEIYYVFNRQQSSPDLQLVKSIENPENYGISHTLDTIGDYFDISLFHVSNLGDNIYIYLLAGDGIELKYLPLPL